MNIAVLFFTHIIAFFLGCFVSFVVMALCIAASEYNRRREQEENGGW